MWKKVFHKIVPFPLLLCFLVCVGRLFYVSRRRKYKTKFLSKESKHRMPCLLSRWFGRLMIQMSFWLLKSFLEGLVSSIREKHSWDLILCKEPQTKKVTHHESMSREVDTARNRKKEEETHRKYREECDSSNWVAASFHRISSLVCSCQRMLWPLQSTAHPQT